MPSGKTWMSLLMGPLANCLQDLELQLQRAMLCDSRHVCSKYAKDSSIMEWGMLIPSVLERRGRGSRRTIVVAAAFRKQDSGPFRTSIRPRENLTDVLLRLSPHQLT